MINRTEKEIMEAWNSADPLVSICTITYNHENFIEEALDSFLMQVTNFPFEIIIDDDCSPDNTAEIIEKYREKFPTIIHAKLREKNIGAISNFLENINRAKGKYIALCEGDDYWMDASKLQKQVDFLETHLDYSISFHTAVYVNGKSEIMPKAYIYKNDYSQDELICGLATMPTAATMIRRSQKDIPEYFKSSYIGDTIIAHYAGFSGKAKFQENIEGSAYRIHDGGVWGGIDQIKRVQASIKTRRMLKKNLEDDSRRLKIIERSVVNTYLEYLFYFLRAKDFKNYRKLIAIIFKDKDTNIAKVVLLHLFDIPKRVINKFFKSIKGKI